MKSLLLGNPVLALGALAWLLAQIIKVLLNAVQRKTWDLKILLSSGGMPSSHSATVCGLTTSAGLCYGMESFEFAICFILASVVMYDAIGVRQETGKQAKLLNLIMEQDLFHLDNEQFQKKLKEFVGHTPLQVFAGAVLGILIAILMHMGLYA